ncbi:MAG: HYR domain-containing protein [bacterium]
MAVNDGNETIKEAAFNVEVIDVITPVLSSVPVDTTIEADSDCEAVLPDYREEITVTDNCVSEPEVTQNPSPDNFISGSSNEAIITATDKSGNETEASFNVEVVDFTDPKITCVSDQTVELSEDVNVYKVSGEEFDPESIDDNCEIETVTNDYNNSSTLEGAEFTEGEEVVMWLVTDKAGNEAQCSFEVSVSQATGIEDLDKKGISLYPNPVNEKLHYNFSDNKIEAVD